MLSSAHDLFRGLPPGTSVAAFNAITLEHAEAIAAAADETGAPVVMQLSQNAIAFHERPEAIAAAMVAVAETASAPIVLHLDHITDEELALRTVDLGFSSVMFDGATRDYEENVAATRRVATWGADHGIWVEAELGEIGGKDGAHAPGVRTDPEEAARFVADTAVDSLAVAVGSSHAMTTQSASLDTDLIERIAASVDVPLVLHGSSGVPDETLLRAARAGMRKINIGTALNIAFTGAVREWLDAHDGVDPRRYIAPGRDAMARTCAHYLEVLR
ncbi:fructose-bisphosphate aldolase [Aeromicrobium sp. PE09-221]|uniref:class II fructose-bisphosphate aldolase n=1 Tax=Aeromicrobium sp. PE09-221 TaxID=1898043 RepID=UPI000B3E742E|nr:class II fructose-bisphosphate aldolase [Aeromicrobium sp. PE09-221]OUZ11978.1 fructose-bisphosphate aldolase [Aeromicrobium sp. PE09-221]